MKFVLATFAALASSVSAGGTKGYLKMDTKDLNDKAVRKLISKSEVIQHPQPRQLEDYFEEAVVASHSVVFEGCHNTSAWEEGSYRMVPLARFSLCPTDSCDDSSGCSSSYKGEYLVELETFVDVYIESKLDAMEYKCEMMRENCGCEGDEDDCLYYCYKNYDDDTFDWSYCVEEGEGEKGRLAECQRLEIEDDEERRGRRLEEEEEEYFLGPYCAASGTAVYLAVFTDEDCMYPAEGGNSIYYGLAGEYHPNFSESLVGTDCTSCLEPKEEEDKNDDDAEDEDEVTRMCEELYNDAFKCETYMSVTYPNTDGCDFIAKLQSSDSSERRFLALKQTVSRSGGLLAVVVGGMTVLSVAAALLVVKKMM